MKNAFDSTADWFSTVGHYYYYYRVTGLLFKEKFNWDWELKKGIGIFWRFGFGTCRNLIVFFVSWNIGNWRISKQLIMEEQHEETAFDSATAGDAELCLLKWNSHQHHFANKFPEFLDDMSFSDVTLACEGNFLQAHKLVLSVCSPYFKNLFKVNCAEKGPATILIANVRCTDLENILHFMYRGQVNVRKEDLNRFLETGEQLQVDGLMGLDTNKSQELQISLSSGGGGDSVQNLNNHVDNNNNPAKKARMSPAGTLKQESLVGINNNNGNSASRRPSTSSSHVSNATSSMSPTHLQKVEGVDTVLVEANNGIKILAVASLNAAAAAAGYDVHVQTSGGNSGGQQPSRLNPNVTARYPSLILL